MKPLSVLRTATLGVIAIGIAILGVADNPRVNPAYAANPVTITSCDDSVWKTTNTLYVIGANLTAPAGRPCLSPTVSGSTIEGNGKTITTDGGPAIVIDNRNNITVKNVISNGGITITGDAADNNSIDLLTTDGAVTVENGDYSFISNSTMTALAVTGSGGDTAYRTTIANNVIEGNSPLAIVGSTAGTCPRGDHVILNNTIISHHADPNTLAGAVRITCSTNNLMNENVVRSTASAKGLILSDGADSGQFINNTFWSNSGESIVIGPNDAGGAAPGGNAFDQNMFRGDGARSFAFEGIGTGTTFTRNIFWGNGTTNGGSLAGANRTTFDHNTFSQSTDGVTALRIAYGASLQADTFTNNIVDYDGPLTEQLDGFSFDRMSSDHNLFHNRSGSAAFGSYGSLTSWRSASTAAGRPQDTNSIEADPLFTDQTNGDFSIRTDSPTRGAGANASDIGALPFGSSRPVTGCIEVWTCTEWTACSGGRQTRTCTDDNKCGTTTNKPLTLRTCGQQDVTAPSAIRTIIAR